MKKKYGYDDLPFEDSISDDWSHDIKIVEVPIGNRPLLYLGIGVLVIVLAIATQIMYLNFAKGSYYKARAADNLAQSQETEAPRGEIVDREGNMLAEDKAAFAALLNTREFLNNADLRTSTIAAVQAVLGITPDAFAALLTQASADEYAT